jgi:hypothetical protein
MRKNPQYYPRDSLEAIGQPCPTAPQTSPGGQSSDCC